jgi:hypothetical protein
MTEKIKNNKNWYLVEIIERCEPNGTVDKRPLRRCIVYGNYHLIKADSTEEAYEKAEKIGREGNYHFNNVDKKDMKWEFIGIGDLLPIYEDIEDGAELMFTDYGFISAKRSDGFVKPKAEWIKKLKMKPIDK